MHAYTYAHILVFFLLIFLLPFSTSKKTGSKYSLCVYLINLGMQQISHLHCHPLLHKFLHPPIWALTPCDNATMLTSFCFGFNSQCQATCPHGCCPYPAQALTSSGRLLLPTSGAFPLLLGYWHSMSGCPLCGHLSHPV